MLYYSFYYICTIVRVLFMYNVILRIPLQYTFSLVFVFIEISIMKVNGKCQLSGVLILFMIWGLFGCNSGSVVKRATGVPYEVMVVMDQDLWEGNVGELLQDHLQSPYPGLPQLEPTAKLSYCTPSSFNDFMRYVRNILLVDVNPQAYTKVSLVSDRDLWANGQLVLRLQSPSKDSLEIYLKEDQSEMLDYIRKVEQRRYANYLQEHYNSFLAEKVKAGFGLEINAPEELSSSKIDSTFHWFSNNANTGRMDMIYYEFPAKSEADLNQSNLIAKRDSVTRQYVPGSFEGSYMKTETRFPIEYESLSSKSHQGASLRGLWKMEGDMMGGPFVSYAWFDKANQRIVVAEGFVYAPETNKKLYMHRLESALLTARLL